MCSQEKLSPTCPPHLCLCFQGKYILTPSPITYGEEQLLHFLGQLLGIAIRADVPLPLDLLPSFWKMLVGEPLDPDQDLQEADILTYNYVKKFESVSEGCLLGEGAPGPCCHPREIHTPSPVDWAPQRTRGLCAISASKACFVGQKPPENVAAEWAEAPG